MEGKKVYLSPEGYRKLKDKLQMLVEEERPRVIQQLAEAREQGDLSENSEYDAAKDAQSSLETEIAILEQTLAAAEVIDNEGKSFDQVKILCRVTLKNLSNGELMECTLVSPIEASLKEHKISIDSPFGLNLLGKKVGDVIPSIANHGKISFEIIKITG